MGDLFVGRPVLRPPPMRPPRAVLLPAGVQGRMVGNILLVSSDRVLPTPAHRRLCDVLEAAGYKLLDGTRARARSDGEVPQPSVDFPPNRVPSI